MTGMNAVTLLPEMSRMRILGVAGSLRRDSYNRRLLRAAAELAPAQAVFTLWDELKDVPPYDQDDEAEPVPAAVTSLRQAITAADAVLIATPEYNSSLPGQLKNALDWASRPTENNALRGKPVAVIGASPSRFGAAWSQAETRKVLTAIGARVVDRELALPQAYEQFDTEDRLHDHDLRRRLGDLLAEVTGKDRSPVGVAA